MSRGYADRTFHFVSKTSLSWRSRVKIGYDVIDTGTEYWDAGRKHNFLITLPWTHCFCTVLLRELYHSTTWTLGILCLVHHCQWCSAAPKSKGRECKHRTIRFCWSLQLSLGRQLEIVDNEQCVGLESLSIGRLGHRQHGISPSVMDCPNRKPSTWLHIFMQFGVLYNYISTLLTEPTVAPSYKSRTKWNSEMTLTHLLPCQWDITRFGLH